jgi:hypothetical protein
MLNVSVMRMQSSNTAAGGPTPQAQSQACVPNIDAAGRRQRLISAIVELVVGFGILAALLAVHASPLWRLPLVLIFWGAGIGFFQWRDRT